MFFGAVDGALDHWRLQDSCTNHPRQPMLHNARNPNLNNLVFVNNLVFLEITRLFVATQKKVGKRFSRYIYENKKQIKRGR